MPGESSFGEGDGGSDIFRFHLSNFSSALGPIFKFVSILGHNFFISPLWDYQNGVNLSALNEFLCPLLAACLTAVPLAQEHLIFKLPQVSLKQIEKFLHFSFKTVKNFSNSKPRPPRKESWAKTRNPEQ